MIHFFIPDSHIHTCCVRLDGKEEIEERVKQKEPNWEKEEMKRILSQENTLAYMYIMI